MNTPQRKIDYIVLHCTAGYGNLGSLQAYWASKGWKTGGYHRLVLENGCIESLYPFSRVTNGVKGYNQRSIHIAYVGGVAKDNYKKALDSRTKAQKESLLVAIGEALSWVKAGGGSLPSLRILGHRDLSVDVNKNGRIDPWERSKACPSFDAIPEYEHLLKL